MAFSHSQQRREGNWACALWSIWSSFLVSFNTPCGLHITAKCQLSCPSILGCPHLDVTGPLAELRWGHSGPWPPLVIEQFPKKALACMAACMHKLESTPVVLHGHMHSLSNTLRTLLFICVRLASINKYLAAILYLFVAFLNSVVVGSEGLDPRYI